MTAVYAFFLPLTILLISQPVSLASQWFRPARCTTVCDENHQCVSDECRVQWDSCYANWSEIRRDEVPDTVNCYDNGCDWGGCDRPGYVEVSKTPCVNLKKLCVGCMEETCCPIRSEVLCCKRYNCTEALADCRVPQQRALGPNNSSRSDIYYTNIASGGSATFPFYSNRSVPQNSSCDSVRLWGSCSCNDGVSVPGCLFNDSSSWSALDTGERLPPRLSLTCLVIASPSPPLPPGLPSALDGDGMPSNDDGTSGEPNKHTSHLSGAKVAGIVVISVLGSMLLVGSLVSAVRLMYTVNTGSGGGGGGGGQRRRDAGLAVGLPTGSSSYSPVFTGQSYTPGLVKPKLVVVTQIQRMWGKWTAMLAKLRGDVAEDAVAVHAAFQKQRAALEARLANKYPRSGPALPTDLEDDELYTLEDLDDPEPMYRNTTSAHVRALEMGNMAGGGVADPLLYTNDSIDPLPPPGTSSVDARQQPQVIHTTAVFLPNAYPLNPHRGGANSSTGPNHKPLTPQPTGSTAPRYQSHHTG